MKISPYAIKVLVSDRTYQRAMWSMDLQRIVCLDWNNDVEDERNRVLHDSAACST